MELSPVEPVRIAGLREQLFGPRGIVRIGLERQGELVAAGDEVSRRPRGAERLGFTQRLAVEGEAGRLPHSLVVPWRFRIPLLEEIEEEDGDAA